MKRALLTKPEMMFVIATRAALAAGAALLLSERIEKRPRRKIGWTLVGLGAATTIPAALIVFRKQEDKEA